MHICVIGSGNGRFLVPSNCPNHSINLSKQTAVKFYSEYTKRYQEIHFDFSSRKGLPLCSTALFSHSKCSEVSWSFGQFEWRHLINDGESPIAEETHYSDVIMGATASQITSLTIVYSTVYSGADRRKHQSSASLAYVLEIYRWPVNSLHRWPVTRKMFPFDDVIMQWD